MRRHTRQAVPDIGDSTGWGRGRLLAIVLAGGAVAVLLLAGVGYAAYVALADLGDEANATPGVARGETNRSAVAKGATYRDEIAAAPMLTVPEDAAFPADKASETAPSIKIPTGTGVNGPGFVLTGFPRTPEGAIGQLAHIDTAVLHSMSLQTAQDVYSTWALPGGVSVEDWWITASVRAFLTSTDMGEIKDPNSSVTLEPSAALVKGTDGTDWATVCVLMKVTATYKQEAQIAFAHCERMQWVGGRWMIAPGTPPATAPSAWPGSPAAAEAGWSTWTTDTSGTTDAGAGDGAGES